MYSRAILSFLPPPYRTTSSSYECGQKVKIALIALGKASSVRGHSCNINIASGEAVENYGGDSL